MAAPYGKYASNRQGALASAMVAAALTTMPQPEGTLRGSMASAAGATSAAADAAAASTTAGVADAVGESATAAGIAAAA